jgi:prevent-host-death family protein
MYNLEMTTLSISELRADIARAVSSTKRAPIAISKHGEPVAFLVSPSMYEKMIDAMEELEDIADFDAAMANPSEGIPWEKVRKDLGLA